MRNSKTMYLLTVIVGILLLGVAYAAIQNITLTINGTATATPDQANFNVKFAGTPTSTVSGHGVATLNITGDTTATMNVSNMTTAGDTVTSKFTVINESTDLTAYLSTTVTHTNTEYFKVTTTLGTTELAPQNTTTELSIIVELKKTPIVEQTDTINVKLVAGPTPIEDDGEEGGGITGGGTGTTVEVGQRVQYDSNNDGEKEDWIVLTSEVGLVEIVSAEAMGSLTLGSDDTTVEVTTDLDGDGTVGNNGDKAIASYNNAITTINNYCKSLVTATDNEGVRSVGASTDTAGDYSSTNFNSWFKNSSTVKVKAGDESYQTDYDKMTELGIADVDTDYWMASRLVSVDEDASIVDFSVRFVDDYGPCFSIILWSVFSDGYVNSDNNPSFALRPVVINPSGI